MIKQGHVGALELFATMTCAQAFTLLYHLPNALGKDAFTGAWLLNLLAGLLSLLVALAMFPLLRRFPGKSIIEIAETVLGRWGGALFSLVVAGFYFYMVSITLRTQADGVVSTIMLDTPVSAVMVAALAAVSVVSYLGLESLTRTVLIFFPFIALGFGIVIFFSLSDSDFNMLYPLMGAPLPNLLLSGGKFAFTAHECLFIMILAPYLRQPKTLFRVTFWSIIVVTGFSTLVLVVVESLLSYPAFQLATFPFYETVRLIHIGPFLQRVEALYTIMEMIISMVYPGLAFHIGVLTLAQGWRLADWRPLIFPSAVIIFSLGSLPKDALALWNWYFSAGNSLFRFALFVLLPISLYFVAAVKGKKGGGQVEEAGG